MPGEPNNNDLSDNTGDSSRLDGNLLLKAFHRQVDFIGQKVLGISHVDAVTLHALSLPDVSEVQPSPRHRRQVVLRLIKPGQLPQYLFCPKHSQHYPMTPSNMVWAS